MNAKFLRIGLWEFIPSIRVSLIPSARTLTATLSWLCFAAYIGYHAKAKRKSELERGGEILRELIKTQQIHMASK